MGLLVPFSMFGYIPFVLFLFMVLPPRRAVIASFLVAWLFLPMAAYKVPSLPDYTKMSATVIGVLLGAAIFDADRLFSFRPRWIDLPMLLWVCSPMASSYLNDLGLYDGTSEIIRQMFAWGLPYIIGRVYFTDLESIRELAVGIFIGGLVYVPLCWFEVRFSPQLHVWVYGFRAGAFDQQMRDGGFRPTVFMQHGLMVGMWMSMTALVGVWLWKSKTIRQLWDTPMYVLVPTLLFTAYLCKSKGALLLLFIGLVALFTTKWVGTKAVIVLMLLAPLGYMYVRAEGIVTGENMVQLAREVFGEERAQSLQFRLDCENQLVVKAMEQPWFGWGGWSRSSVVNDDGKSVITDSLFIITLGKAGWVGLFGLYLMLVLPMFLVCWDWRLELWTHPVVAPVVALGIVTSLYMYDHLMNGMVNPIFMLALGAVASAHYAVPQAARRAVRTMRQPQPTRPGGLPVGTMPTPVHVNVAPRPAVQIFRSMN
jgi:hypothetical protein